MALPLFLTRLLIRTGIARFLPSVQRQTEGGGDFLHYYSNRILTAPHGDLREAAAHVGVPGADAIDLALGAPRFDMVPSSSTKLPAERRGLPPAAGWEDLRQAVAEHLATRQRLWVRAADEIVITHGAAGAFNVALESFVNPGDRVVLFDPTSPLFVLAARYRRARIRWLATRVEQGRTRFQLDQLAKALHRARLVVVNSPVNPTGGVIAAEDLEQIAWWAKHHDVLIYSDEVFARYQYGEPGVSIATLPLARQRTLTAGSVSQGYALASARVGWLAGYRYLMRPCTLAGVCQAPFVPTLCQQVALAALRQDEEAFGPIREEFAARRQYVYERLRGLGLDPVWPAGAYFFWVPIGPLGLSGRNFAEQLLGTKKVRVWPGEMFGPSGAGHIRVSYAAEDGRLREGLNRLAELVGELQGTAKKTTPGGPPVSATGPG